MKITKKILLTTLFLTLSIISTKETSGATIKQIPPPTSFLRAAISLPEEFHPVYAPVVTIEGGDETSYGNYFLQLLAGSLIYLAAPTAVLIIAIGGLRYVTSHGDQTQMDGAKNTLKWATVGLIVIILSFAIVRGVISFVLGVG